MYCHFEQLLFLLFSVILKLSNEAVRTFMLTISFYFYCPEMVAGYGCSSIITSFVGYRMLNHFKAPPTFAGKDVEMVSENGRLFLDNGNMDEIVVATAKDLSEWVDFGLEEGAYLVGTGSTGVAETLLTIGCAYGTLMTIAAFQYRYPKEDAATAPLASAAALPENPVTSTQAPPTATPTQTSAPAPKLTLHNVDTKVATFSKEFGLMYLGFGMAAAGAYGFIGAGKTMVGECFGPVITPAFAAGFVAAMGAGNLAGRVGWTLASDYLVAVDKGIPGLLPANQTDPFWGRRAAFTLMFMVPAPAIALAYYCVHQPPSPIMLYGFTGSVIAVISSFGGMAAARPAFCADLWGLKNGPGVLSARQLSVVLPASFAGPMIVSHFRQTATRDAVADLSSQVPDAAFEAAFLAPKEDIASLVEAKTVTINRLLELLPAGTVDPTPCLYDSALMVLSAGSLVALGTNMLLRPVHPKLHMRESSE